MGLGRRDAERALRDALHVLSGCQGTRRAFLWRYFGRGRRGRRRPTKRWRHGRARLGGRCGLAPHKRTTSICERVCDLIKVDRLIVAGGLLVGWRAYGRRLTPARGLRGDAGRGRRRGSLSLFVVVLYILLIIRFKVLVVFTVVFMVARRGRYRVGRHGEGAQPSSRDGRLTERHVPCKTEGALVLAAFRRACRVAERRQAPNFPRRHRCRSWLDDPRRGTSDASQGVLHHVMHMLSQPFGARGFSSVPEKSVDCNSVPTSSGRSSVSALRNESSPHSIEARVPGRAAVPAPAQAA